MRDLAELQQHMTAAILAGDFSTIAHQFAAGPVSAASRLNIHRNNTFLSLTAALKSTFPVTVQLVHERFFAFAADGFIATHPPLEARLARYGRDFPRFLSRFPPCRDLPLAAQMASFEWAMAEANVSAVEPAAESEHLQSLARGRSIVLQPSLRFVISAWPVDRIWLAHRRNTLEAEQPFTPEVRRVAVYAGAHGPQFAALSRPRFSFWRQLRRGRSVEHALSCALARDPMFDPVAEILALFRQGLIVRPVGSSIH